MDPRPSSIWHRLSPLIGPAGVQLVRLRGRARYTSAPISALYAGNGRNAEFLRGLFFAEAEEEPLGRFSTPLRLQARVRQMLENDDLYLGELPPAWRILDSKAADIRIPAWIRQIVILRPEAGQSGGRLLPRSLEREAGRHIRRRGYRFEISTSEKDIRAFYRDMYKPYVKSRFGPEAVLVQEMEFLARCRHEPLAKLLVGDRWVAAMLLHRSGKHLRLGWFGTTDDPPPAGASEVLDVLSLHYARDRGVEKVVLGNARPCLADGVVRYKARFHPRIEAARFPQAALSITVNNPTAAVFECLERQPLIAPMGNLMGAYRVFRDNDRHPRLRLEPLHVVA